MRFNRPFQAALIVFACLIVMAGQSGCNGRAPAANTNQPTETASPSPAVETPVENATAPTNPTPLPTATLAPTTDASDTPPIVVQPTATPGNSTAFIEYKNILPAAIRIYRPGAASRVVSPIKLEADLYPGDDGLVTIELLGEDGRLMARQILKYPDSIGQRISIAVAIPFELSSVSEAARLVVHVSDTFGRIKTLASVDVILLQMGDNDYNLADSFQRMPYTVLEPGAGSVQRNGEVVVRGVGRPYSGNPLIIELLDPQGKILGSKQVLLKCEGDGCMAEFSAVIPFKITKPVEARLSLRQLSDGRIAGTIALSSQVLFLKP